MADGEINSISDVLQAVDSFRGKAEEHTHLRIWFRGQGRPWPLSPNVYRKDFLSTREGETRGENDSRRLRKEAHLTQDFLHFSAQLRSGRETDEELYFLQQHYGMPTRLLDWSTTPLTALFFVVNSEAEHAGAMYMLDAYGFVGDTGIATVRRKEFKAALSTIFDWKQDAEWPTDILPVRPQHFDLRIVAQKGYFTFHPKGKPELTRADNSTLNEFTVPSSAKERIRKELDLLGVDEFTIYGDLDHLASRLKRAY